MSDYIPPAGQPDQLAPQQQGGSGKKAVIIGGAVVGVAALVGGGVWAATSFLGTGAQPAEALPASTLAYVSVDLDPSGSQKIEAIRTLRKFPAFRDQVDVETDDDLRKTIIDEALSSGNCDNIDYADDIEPWLGERFGMAVLDAAESPDVAFVVQVTDEGAAEDGLTAIKDCAGGENGFWSIADGWAVIGETEEIVKSATDDAAESSLADDETYQKWTGEAGDSGILSLYAAPAAGEAIAEFLPGMGGLPMVPGMGADPFGGQDPFGGEDPFGGDEPTEAPTDPGTTDPGTDPFGDESGEENPFIDENGNFDEEAFNKYLEEMEQEYGSGDTQSAPAPGVQAQTASFATSSTETPDDAVTEQLKNFPGFAGVLRFSDGGLEFEMVTDAGEEAEEIISSGSAGDLVASLPEDTAVAAGLGFAEGWYDAAIASINESMQGLIDVEAEIAAFEEQAGIKVSEVAEDLAGEGLAIALGGDFTVEGFMNSADGSDVPVGVKIKGDADKIESALDEVRTQIGPEAADVLGSEAEGDFVAVSPNESFRSALAADGDLGGSDNFTDAIPNADQATGLLYLNFDAGDDWLTSVVEQAGAPAGVLENVEPLASLGLSSWLDGDVSHFTFRIGTNDE